MNYESAREWLDAAKYDLIVIEEIIKKEILTPVASFHSQQLIEKTLKALLELHEREVPKIHSVKRLFKLVEDIIDLEADDKLLIKIDSLYIDARYPGDFGLLPDGKPSIEESKEFYNYARKIFTAVSIKAKYNIDKES